jgi:ATP-dependent protease ClpP protease subunit
MICASGAMFWIIIIGSIGGKITIGESVMDIMPFWPDFTSTIVLPLWISMVMLVFGIASIIVALKLGPTIRKISD